MSELKRAYLKKYSETTNYTAQPSSLPSVTEKRIFGRYQFVQLRGECRIYLSKVTVLYTVLYITSPPTIVMATGISLISGGDTS